MCSFYNSKQIKSADIREPKIDELKYILEIKINNLKSEEIRTLEEENLKAELFQLSKSLVDKDLEIKNLKTYNVFRDF